MTAYRRVYDSHHLQVTAKNWDQLRNPTLVNRVRSTFTFTFLSASVRVQVDAVTLKMHDLKMTDKNYGVWKMPDWKMTDKLAALAFLCSVC